MNVILIILIISRVLRSSIGKSCSGSGAGCGAGGDTDGRSCCGGKASGHNAVATVLAATKNIETTTTKYFGHTQKSRVRKLS